MVMGFRIKPLLPWWPLIILHKTLEPAEIIVYAETFLINGKMQDNLRKYK